LKHQLQTSLLPAINWGTQFPLVPFANVTDQQYQIVADTIGTIVTAVGQEYRLNAGDYVLVNISGTAMLTSNNPIQTIQMGQVKRVWRLFESK
jgi:hypothetical protein